MKRSRTAEEGTSCRKTDDQQELNLTEVEMQARRIDNKRKRLEEPKKPEERKKKEKKRKFEKLVN